MKTLKYYHDLYLKCEIFLLTDVFQKFRTNSLKNHGLWPSHYLSGLGLRWDPMLKITKIELEIIPDFDMYILFEKGIRSIMFYIFKRYSKTNNNCLKSYDPKQEPKHIIYLDVNDFYGYAMPKFLATSRFLKKYTVKYTINKQTWINILAIVLKGCILEVDLKYPKELLELHNDYPLASDKIEIKRKILSEYQLKLADVYNIPFGNVKKLVHNLFDKEKYVLH